LKKILSFFNQIQLKIEFGIIFSLKEEVLSHFSLKNTLIKID